MGEAPALVSIVTPSLNQARFIRETVESVAAQDYPMIEHIVIDGGSTDGTLEILEDYGDRLTWVSEPDGGQSAAINKGFAMARGEILTWLNSDDALLPGAVATAVAEFERDPELGMVYGDGYVTDESRAFRIEVRTLEPNLWVLQNVSCSVFQPAAFFRRDVLEDVGYLDESLHWVMDWDLWLRISRRYRTRHVRELLATARFYPECKTASGGFRRYREIVAMLQRNGGRRYSWARALHAFEVLVTAVEGFWESTFHRGPSRAGTLQSRAVNAVAHFQTLAFDRALGWWPDGWTSPRVRVRLPARSRALRLEGEVPPLPSLRGQRVRVACNGDDLVDVVLPPGSFRLDVPLRTPSGREDELTIRAERTVARSERPKRERRRLAFRLDALEPTAASEPWLEITPDLSGSGWYPDKWLAPRAVLWVRPFGGRIAIAGEVPVERAQIHGQKLTLSWNGQAVREAEIGAGKFSCEFDVEGDARAYGCLEISCSRSFVPRREGINADERRLAVIVDRVAGVAPPAECSMRRL